MNRHLFTTAIGFATLVSMNSVCADGFFRTNDVWTGKDKALHALAGSYVAIAGTRMSGEFNKGALAGCAVGFAKEVVDSVRKGHDSSLQDFAMTCAASYLAARASNHLVVVPNGVIVQFRF